MPPAIPLREPFPLTHVRLLPDDDGGGISLDDMSDGSLSLGSGRQRGTPRPIGRSGSAHLAARQRNARYLLKTLDAHKLLANFRITAGLAPIAVPYCDLDTPARLQPHTFSPKMIKPKL